MSDNYNKEHLDREASNNSIVMYMQGMNTVPSGLVFFPKITASILTVLGVSRWLSQKTKEKISKQDILDYVDAGYLYLTKSKVYCELTSHTDLGDTFGELMANRLPYEVLSVTPVTDGNNFEGKSITYKGETYNFPLGGFHKFPTVKYKRNATTFDIKNGRRTFHRDIIVVEYIKAEDLMRFMLQYFPEELKAIEIQCAKDNGITKEAKKKKKKTPVLEQRTNALKIWLEENEIEIQTPLKIQKKTLWVLLQTKDPSLFAVGFDDFFKDCSIKLIFPSGKSNWREGDPYQ